MDECEAYASQFSSPHWHKFRTGPFCLAFSDARIYKAYPLNIICQRIGISLKQTIAFGDTSNDNEILKTAGWGVCMFNGTEDTKNISDDVTALSAYEDGLADYLEKEVLQRNGWSVQCGGEK